MFKRLFSAIYIILSAFALNAQYIYPERFGNYSHISFCLDCGDVPMEFPKNLKQHLNQYFNLKHQNKTNGYLKLQVLLDTLGQPFLISAHNKTDVTSKNLNLPFAIHDLDQWIPAIEKGHKTNSVVTLGLEFKNGELVEVKKIPPFNQFSFMRSIGIPEVEGNHPALLSERWYTYMRHNSILPWDMCRAVAVDKNNIIWIGTDDGIVKIENDQWKIINSANSPLKRNIHEKIPSILDIVVDQKDNKWFAAGHNIYKYDNKSWTVYDPIKSSVEWPDRLYADPSGKLWVCSPCGLASFDGDKWDVMNTKNSSLPNDTICGVYVDSKKRLWVGTYGGAIVIDGQVTTKLMDLIPTIKHTRMYQMEEDKSGNLYFRMANKDSRDGDIYILKTDGSSARLAKNKFDFLTKYPLNDFLLDQEKNHLWIAVNNVGIVRYDLTSKKREIYTNLNSNIRSAYVLKLAKDKEGRIWASSLAGVSKTITKRSPLN